MPRTGQLYIIGDSLSDDGATGVQLSDEPIEIFFGGRASNGFVWHEYIRNDLAVAPAAQSISRAPDGDGFLGGSDLNGVNFAHSGAESSSTSNPIRPGGVQQAEGFAALVASGDIPAPDDQDVFVIWIGGNDFLDYADASLFDLLEILRLGETIVDNITTTVDILSTVGAQNFLLIGQPTVGGAFLGARAEESPLIAAIWNRLAEGFNDRLEAYAQSLDSTEGQTALYVDMASFVAALEDDPAAFGFANVTSDIFTDGAAFDDQSYFSVDGIHPTGAGHAAIAAHVAAIAAAAGFDLTALAGNVLPGSYRDETLTGTDGNDSLTGNGGDDMLIGNAGRDIAFFNGPDTRYTLSIANGVTVTDRSGADGSDMLSGIETLDFAGDAFAMDRFDDAASLSQDALRSLTEVYISYFNRAPDALGLAFWADAFANGVTLADIAEHFAASPEANAVFPQDLPALDFVTSVYLNALGRAPDEAGYDFWTDMLISGTISRAQFVREVLQGTRADPPQDATEDFIAQQAADRDFLDTKVEIGLYFAATLGMSNVENAATVMGLFDGSPDSVELATIATEEAFETASAADGTGEFLVQITGGSDDPGLV